VEEIPFPTVVVCPDREAPIDSINLFQLILNYLPYECQPHLAQKCPPQGEFVRQLLLPLLTPMLRKMGDQVLSSGSFGYLAVPRKFHDLYSELEDFAMTDHSQFVDKAIALIAENGTNYDEMVDLLASKMGECTLTRLTDFNESCSQRAIDELSGNASVCEDGANRGACRSARYSAESLKWLAFFVDRTGFEEIGSVVMAGLTELAASLLHQHKFERQHFNRPELALRNDSMAKYAHGVASMLTNLAFFGVDEMQDEAISLFDLPLLAGLWPERRINPYDREYTNREYMPYTFQGLGVHSRGALDKSILNLCIEAITDWLNSDRKDTDVMPKCGFGHEKLQALVKSNLLTLMTIMSYSKRLGVTDPQFFMKPYCSTGKLCEVTPEMRREFQYGSYLPLCHLISQSMQNRRNQLKSYPGVTLIPECDNSIFRPIPTDNGICFAFNAHNALKNSTFLATMQAAFNQSAHFSKEDLAKGIPGGSKKGLTFLVDKHTALNGEWHDIDKGYPTGGYNLAILDTLTSFGFRGKQSYLQIGYHTTITVKTGVLESGEDIRGLDPRERNCFFEDENVDQMKIFNSYSQIGCQTECLLSLARSTCGCTPWDYPFSGEEDVSLCTFQGYYCFNEVMSNYSACSNCTPDCTITQHELIWRSQPFDVDSLCATKSWLTPLINSERKRESTFAKYFRRLVYPEEDYKIKREDQDQWICEYLLGNDLALVTVEMDPGGYTLSTKNLRTSMTEKLASFGGTLGLFTGMSFVSIAEIIYWGLRAALSLISPKKLSLVNSV